MLIDIERSGILAELLPNQFNFSLIKLCLNLKHGHIWNVDHLIQDVQQRIVRIVECTFTCNLVNLLLVLDDVVFLFSHEVEIQKYSLLEELVEELPEGFVEEQLAVVLVVHAVGRAVVNDQLFKDIWLHILLVEVVLMVNSFDFLSKRVDHSFEQVFPQSLVAGVGEGFILDPHQLVHDNNKDIFVYYRLVFCLLVDYIPFLCLQCENFGQCFPCDHVLWFGWRRNFVSDKLVDFLNGSSILGWIYIDFCVVIEQID